MENLLVAGTKKGVKQSIVFKIYKMNKKIIENINIDFSEEERELVISELSSLKRSNAMASSEYNLYHTRFSILKLAKWDINKVIEFTKFAKIDFRDVIMWAMQDKWGNMKFYKRIKLVKHVKTKL